MSMITRPLPVPTVYGEAALHVVTSARPSRQVSFATVAVAVGGPAAVVALQLARLGHPPTLVSALGGDSPGGFVRAELAGAGVDCTYVACLGRTPRIIATVVGGEVELVADVDDNPWSALTAAQLPAPGPGPAYITGFPAQRAAIAHLAERGHRLVVDVGFIPLLSQPRALAAHVRELVPAIDVAVISGAGLEPRCRQELAEMCLSGGARAVLTTLAADGVLVDTPDETRHLNAYRVDVVDPLCAGDTFIAGFLAGRIEGLDTFAAAGFGQAVAAVKLTGLARTPTRAEVQAFLDNASTATRGAGA